MIYTDKIYGRTTITEPVILDIINGPTMQRLKGVDQAGYFEPYYPGSAHTRFEHSLGVYLLLRRFGAPLAEQVSGLIHDVSHSAFSHCIDYVGGVRAEKNQSYQEDIHDDFVRRSELPAVLKKYNLQTDYILDDKNFPLKEVSLPDVCADRLDYSLRDGFHYGFLTKKEIDYFLKNIAVVNRRWVFKDKLGAQKFAEVFRQINRLCWSDHKSAVMLKTTGKVLKYSLQKKYITAADLYTTDQEVLKKISEHFTADSQLQELLDRMNNKRGYHLNTKKFDIRAFCKSRMIDPLCRQDNKIQRLSAVNPAWSEIVKRESCPKEYFIKFGQPRR